jgi:hypothetical protein
MITGLLVGVGLIVLTVFVLALTQFWEWLHGTLHRWYEDQLDRHFHLIGLLYLGGFLAGCGLIGWVLSK